MIYHNYADMLNCIRRDAWKVPSDVDLIVGIPRAGMIPALILAELLNKRCADLDTFIEGRETSFGRRGGMMRSGTPGKVLVMDDSVCSGVALVKVRERLAPLTDRYDILYGTIYLENPDAKSMVDIYFEDISMQGSRVFWKEWNILHLFPKRVKKSMWDIDGLLCKDPPDDRDIIAYERYLPKAIPMVIPSSKVGAIVTYRLEKYRGVTEEWLRKNGVEYDRLMMFNAQSRDERNQTESPSNYKARLYREASWAQLFIESEPRQAERICQRSGKPVYCYANGKLYQ